MKITEPEVVHVARLARLKLNTGEVEQFQKDLNSILGYMDMLSEIDTTGITPVVHATNIMNVMRPDTIIGSQTLSDALSNAPKHKAGNIVVPKVIE
ncbi:MAG: Asp-tRNA(Asn)/Glu-tRNA(Gln) amidotransferase subunit GatC [Deltaproteobacteria bacterium]|nr:Asp-tRNA(Asn)/Glu-tRNA(Gln) amidotransferase subunit GatC [Deltaproteobacteria bacterium]